MLQILFHLPSIIFLSFLKVSVHNYSQKFVLFPDLLMFTCQSSGLWLFDCPSMVPEGQETGQSEHGRPYKHLWGWSLVATPVVLIEKNYQSKVVHSNSFYPYYLVKGRLGSLEIKKKLKNISSEEAPLGRWKVWQSKQSKSMVGDKKCPGITRRCAVILTWSGEINRWETVEIRKLLEELIDVPWEMKKNCQSLQEKSLGR